MDSYKVTFQTWDKVALTYQDMFMDFGLYHDTYDTFCGLIDKPCAKIFEIGCGPGNITKYLISRRLDFIIEAIDVAPKMIELAKKNNPTVNFMVKDCRTIDSIMSEYDGIICGFCMPYLSREDCAKLIKDCSLLMNSGGILYVSTIEGDNYLHGYETGSKGEMYVYYHREDYLLNEVESNEFELLAIKHKNYLQKDGKNSTHLILIAKKK
jgi:2-polyprenyl-3-methyl-5-hydroxy-6-metoxy-1,4-benzoquinol methylase